MVDPFIQAPPSLGNQYDEDHALRALLERLLPENSRAPIETELRQMGALAGGELHALQLEDREAEPILRHWDPWGNRVDAIEHTAVWRRAEQIASTHGVVATAYEGRHGALSRVHQFALAYLFAPCTDVFACPLAMTDGMARSLIASGNEALRDAVLPHLMSRDPATFWTSGQWMTEAIGGSDVGLSEAIAREEGGQWRLYGRKWFTSAASSQVALTLARPEGNPPGGRGLALFFVRCHDDAGRLQGIQLNRLKEKLGTRKLPTAELELLGTPAIPVMGLENGVRNITPMLNITRTWNAVVAASAMRRAIALSRDYARRRHAFGAELIDKPLHVDTLAAMQAELEGALQLTFFVVQLLGRAEHGELDTPTERLLRLLTPIAKLTTGKQAVAVTSEALECFGGAGYVEDTGIAGLLRDAQVLPIWEGTTNVLSLDVLRALSREGGLEELGALLEAIQEEALDPGLKKAARVATKALERAIEWLEEAQKAGPAEVEAGARRFALTLGRATELGLLVRQAQWSLAHASDRRPRAAALRFAQTAIDQIAWCDREEAGLLAREVGEM